MYVKTQIMELFDALRKKIIVDFIIKLLKSKNPMMGVFYDSIIIVVNTLAKCSHFILFKELFDAGQLRHFFIDWIIQYQNFPHNIINDKNKFFTFMY